jgi:hypothetical protein
VRGTSQESKEGTDLEKWKKDRKSRINSTWKRDKEERKVKERGWGGRMGKNQSRGRVNKNCGGIGALNLSA